MPFLYGLGIWVWKFWYSGEGPSLGRHGARHRRDADEARRSSAKSVGYLAISLVGFFLLLARNTFTASTRSRNHRSRTDLRAEVSIEIAGGAGDGRGPRGGVPAYEGIRPACLRELPRAPEANRRPAFRAGLQATRRRDDLKNSNYKGDDPRLFFPHPSTEAYISFNERVAKRMPIARLAIACVLEGIGGQLGNSYGKKLVQILGLTKEQTSFFLSHGETDKHHMHELAEVINGSELSPEEWGWMTQAATVAGQLYSNMYSHEGFH